MKAKERTKSDISNENYMKFAHSEKAKKHQKAHHEKVMKSINKTKAKMKHSKEDLHHAHKHMMEHMH